MRKHLALGVVALAILAGCTSGSDEQGGPLLPDL